MNATSNFSLQSAPRAFNGIVFRCIGRQENQGLRVFSRKVLPNFFLMKCRVIHDDDMIRWQLLLQFLFKPVFEHRSVHRSAVGVRSKQSTFTLRCNKPNSSMALAADTDVDALSAFTARILAVHLRLDSGFIDIYELLFGNVFNFF